MAKTWSLQVDLDSNSKEESSRNRMAAADGFQKLLAAVMEWWHSRAGSGEWLRLRPQTLCLRQKRAPELIRPLRTHPEHAWVFYFPIGAGLFISPHVFPPQDWGFKSHSVGRPLSVAYSFLLLLIEGIVRFHSCDHSRQRCLVTEDINVHFFP